MLEQQLKTQKFIDSKYKNDLNIKFGTLSINEKLFDIQKMRFLENLNLIKSIPAEILNNIESTLSNIVISGDLQELENRLKTIKGISSRRAKTIARDQNAKMLEGVNIARQQQLGIEYYEWVTSRDERVSKGYGGHDKLDKKIFKYDEPEAIIDSYGNKGHPSQRVNCRCIARGIILEPDEKIEKATIGYKIVKK